MKAKQQPGIVHHVAYVTAAPQILVKVDNGAYAIADVQGELREIEAIRLELAKDEDVGSLPTRHVDDTAMVISLA